VGTLAGQSEGWPWWVSPLIFIAVVLCVAVVAAAVWMGYDDHKRRQRKVGGAGGHLSPADSFDENAGLLGFQNINMPNMHMPWSGDPSYTAVSGGMPGYGDVPMQHPLGGHPDAHRFSHGGRLF